MADVTEFKLQSDALGKEFKRRVYKHDDGTYSFEAPASAGSTSDAKDATLQAILQAVQNDRDLTLWTDDSGAFYVRVDKNGTISWVTPTGAASSAPGTGARPAAGASVLVDTTRYQANKNGTGYSSGDYIAHIVTLDPQSGVQLGNFWLNATTSAKISGPPTADISPISPLPTDAATNTKLEALRAILALVATDQNITNLIAKDEAIRALLASGIALAAGETHLGEIGGKTGIVGANVAAQAAQYAAGQTIGGLIPLSALMRVAGGTGIIQTVNILSKSAQSAPIDVIIFNTNPTNTTFADKTALALNVADFDKVSGVVHITDWTSLGTPSNGQALGVGLAMKTAAGTQDAYAVLVARASLTLASATDLRLAVKALLD